MEEFVVSRALAQELRDAGFSQHARYGYYLIVGYEEEPHNREGFGPCSMMDDIGHELLCVTPMSDELLELLPEYIILDRGIGGAYNLNIQKVHREYRIIYNTIIYVKDGRMPDALAMAWLYLKKHGYLEAQAA